MKVLIVDDNKQIISILEAYAKKESEVGKNILGLK